MESYHDISIPYTQEDVQKYFEIARTNKNYREQDDSLPASEIPNILEAINLKRTNEQLEAYVQFFNEHFNGRFNVQESSQLMLNVHSTSSYGRVYLNKFDTDRDGLISAGEFAELLKMFEIHEPNLRGKTFEEFVKEADINLNGKVSIDECESWIRKFSN